jgi:hypothetical protein
MLMAKYRQRTFLMLFMVSSVSQLEAAALQNYLSGFAEYSQYVSSNC